MTSITKKILESPGRWVKPIAVSIALNYLLLGGVMILLSYILKLQDPYRVGFIVLASAPPAIAVIPFTNFLGGDPDYSLVGFTACYLGAFLLTPLTLSTFLGSQPGFRFRILTLLSQLIIVPFLLSRLLVRFGVDERIAPYKGTMVNWSFFVIIYTIVGLNNEVFLRDPISLAPLAAIALVATFIIGYIVEKVSRSLEVGSSKTLSNVLLATSKNSGFAAGIAITLFSVESTVPSTLTTIFMLLYVIYLDIKKTSKMK
jgi:BASS family bile acid:Na+ symporter